MPTAGYQPIEVKGFAGLNTLLDPTNLPIHASPDCQDVEFLPGLVRTRAGLGSPAEVLLAPANVNYLKSFILPNQQVRMLTAGADGNLYKENVSGVPGTLVNIFGPSLTGAYINSVTQFGREYMAFGDGQNGYDLPRAYDDMNIDRVSQEGPGQAPGVADEGLTFTIAAGPTGAVQLSPITIVAGPTGLTEVGNIVTVLLVGGGLFAGDIIPGDSVQIAGAGVAGYNGTFKVTSVQTQLIAGAPIIVSVQVYNPTSGLAASGGGTLATALASFSLSGVLPFPGGILNNSPFPLVTVAGVGVGAYNGTWQVRSNQNTNLPFAYIGTFGNVSSGGGTLAPSGSIIAGVHKVSVMFVTRNGYITAPAPFGSWTAGGGKRVVVSNIPIGPPNIVQRILIFTAAGGLNFFYVNNDTTIYSSTMVINDNTTTTVTVDFSDALLLTGVPADDFFNLIELADSLGVIAYSSRMFWWGGRNTVKNFNNLGFNGGFFVVSGVNVCPLGWTPDSTNFVGGSKATSSVFGDAFRISGSGAAGTRGLMTQNAALDSIGNPILLPNTAYSVSARVASTGINFTGGTLHINLSSISGSFTTVGLAIPLSSLTGSFAFYSATILPALATIPSDLVLQVYVDGTPSPSGAAHCDIDSINIFPTNAPFEPSIVRASFVEDPDSYDGVSGIMSVDENNGQSIRNAYLIRNNLYIVKEHSLYVTQDDDVNEPNQWQIQEVSKKVGTPSARGVGIGDEWVIIAGESGAWLHTGGILSDDSDLTKEIKPTWNQINWNLGYLIDVKVDTKRKRIYISIPFGSTATKNNRILTLDYTEGWQDSTETGVGRKWSPWAIANSSQNLIMRQDGTQQFWSGSNDGSGNIFQLDPTRTIFNDNGVAINNYWQSGFGQDGKRLSWGYLVANLIGSGNLNLLFRKGDMGWATQARSWILSQFGFHNMERQIKFDTERLAVRFGTSGIGDNFSLQGFSLWAKESPWQPLRGINQ